MTNQDENSIDLAVKRLAEDWYTNRPSHCDLGEMCSYPSYQEIIRFGYPAVRPILLELTKHLDHWFVALYAITGENPVPEEDQGKIGRMREAWIKWGKENGYLEQ